MDRNTAPMGLKVNIRPAFGSTEPAFMEKWNKVCNEFSYKLVELLGDRAYHELQSLGPQVQEVKQQMLDLIPEDEEKQKALTYLSEVVERDAPENKQKRGEKIERSRNNRSNNRNQGYNTRNRDNRPTNRRDNRRGTQTTTDSEEDLLQLIRAIKTRRNRRN